MNRRVCRSYCTGRNISTCASTPALYACQHRAWRRVAAKLHGAICVCFGKQSGLRPQPKKPFVSREQVPASTMIEPLATPAKTMRAMPARRAGAARSMPWRGVSSSRATNNLFFYELLARESLSPMAPMPHHPSHPCSRKLAK